MLFLALKCKGLCAGIREKPLGPKDSPNLAASKETGFSVL